MRTHLIAIIVGRARHPRDDDGNEAALPAAGLDAVDARRKSKAVVVVGKSSEARSTRAMMGMCVRRGEGRIE